MVHYFFPAERNPLVEIVPGEETSEEVAAWLLDFYEAIGKVPIRVESRYGYAIDPIFEGLFQAAALAVEEGLGTTREVDDVAREVLGLAVGPFTAMNLTGGNPITAHGLDEMSQRVNPWFRTPEIMKKAMAMGTPWDVPSRDESVEVAPERAAAIRERMTGAYFGLANEVLSSGIVSLADLELGCELALVIRPPFSFMNQVGVGAALEKVRSYQQLYPSFPVSEALVSREASGMPWEIPHVIRRDYEDIAVLVIRRPQVLNALNLEVYRQLAAHLEALRKDESVRGVVITGFGRKAFVSGADVSMLARISSREEGEEHVLGLAPGDDPGRGLRKAGDLRVQRPRFWRRKRARHGLPRPARAEGFVTARGAAGAEPGNHSWSRGDPAASTAHRSREGVAAPPHGKSPFERGSGSARPGEGGNRGRPDSGRSRARPRRRRGAKSSSRESRGSRSRFRMRFPKSISAISPGPSTR